MPGSMQAPRCSRRIWLAFAESLGKGRVPTRPGWAGQKAERAHREKGLSWQARGGRVRRRLGWASEKAENVSAHRRRAGEAGEGRGAGGLGARGWEGGKSQESL